MGIFICEQKHETLIAKLFEGLPEIIDDEITGALCVVRTKDGLTLFDYADITIDDQILMAEHIRMDAMERYLKTMGIDE